MSISLTIIIALLVLLLIFGASFYVVYKDNKKLKNQIEAYKMETESLHKNIAYLMKNAEDIAKIKKEADKISDKINGAKTDEEISDIVSAIISANNDRVQKH
jgi:cell division protein FtsB